MSKHILLFLLASLAFVPCVQGQTKKINALKNQKAEIERGIKRSKSELNQTRQDVAKKENVIDFIEDQLEQRLRYIHELEGEMQRLDRQIDTLKAETERLQSELDGKKEKYKQSLRIAQSGSSLKSPSLFIFSAQTFRQMYRRMRYAREYAAYQKQLGIEVMGKQQQLRTKQNELLEVKQQRQGVVQEIIKQRRALSAQHSVETTKVANLKKREKEIEKQVAEQQKQLNALTKKIDELVAYEIEQARKRAAEQARREAEAKRKREAEAARLAAEKQGKGGKNTKSTKKGKDTPAKTDNTPPPSKWLTAQDQKLNGSFEHNKGRLPVPITGPYRIGNRFGIYQVAGLANVKLDNKGTNYIGQSGARARAIFDGEVSAVFQLGSNKNILVRHGSYISVYCNLSSVIVSRGAQVKARDILGTVAADGDGNYVLHFQLRKETAKLNPEAWIGR